MNTLNKWVQISRNYFINHPLKELNIFLLYSETSTSALICHFPPQSFSLNSTLKISMLFHYFMTISSHPSSINKFSYTLHDVLNKFKIKINPYWYVFYCSKQNIKHKPQPTSTVKIRQDKPNWTFADI